MPTRTGSADAATYQQKSYSQPSTLAQVQAKEADIQALAELTRALDKKVVICSICCYHSVSTLSLDCIMVSAWI